MDGGANRIAITAVTVVASAGFAIAAMPRL